MAKKKKVAPKAAPQIYVSHTVWEQLWRVVDAARYAVCPARGQSRDDALSFLADQEKMLRRAVGLGNFESVEANEADWRRETGVTPHPYITELEQQDRALLRESLSEAGLLDRPESTKR